jgi:hypothetical protein
MLKMINIWELNFLTSLYCFLFLWLTSSSLVQLVAQTCLLIASKSAETLRKARDIINTVFYITNQNEILKLDNVYDTFFVIVLQTITFCMINFS